MSIKPNDAKRKKLSADDLTKAIETTKDAKSKKDFSAGAFTSSTLVPVGAIISTVGIIGTCALWLNTQLNDINHSIELFNKEIKTMEIKVNANMHALSKDKWTIGDMKRWVKLFKISNNNNTNLIIPNVED